MEPLPEVQPPLMLSVTVKFGDHPSEKPDAVAHIEFDENPGLTLEQVSSELLALAAAHDPLNRYDLSTNYDHYSWGADSSAAQIIIYLGELVASAAIGVVVKDLFDRLVAKSQDHVGTLDRRLAMEKARLRVATDYEESARKLQVTREVETQAGTTWVIHLESDKTGASYEVTVVGWKKRAIVTLLTRTLGERSER